MVNSHVHQEVELPSDGVEAVIKNEESSHTRPLGLMDLPIDIFNQILETLDSIAKQETREIYDQNYKSRVEIAGPADQKRYNTYLHQNSPILNSFQAFAITSPEIYQHCQPRLWQFPSSLPAPIDLWTNDLLVRQGSHVQSLSLNLSENCSKPPGEFIEHHPSYDNLSFQNYMGARTACVSPKTVKDLIESCPNLSSMNIEYYEGGTEAFLSNLIPSLSNLKNFRHLKFKDGNLDACMKEFPSKLADGLPLLESLDFMGFRGFGDDGKIGDGSFGSHLSKLKHLSQLHLSHISDLNESWCVYEWPRTITDLAIDHCGHFSPISAYLLVHSIAPEVKKLALRFVQRNDEECWKIDPIGDHQCRFSLPFLTDLELSTKNPNSLRSFQDCISITNLRWDYRTSAHCQTLNDILFQATWPHLKKLMVVDHTWIFGANIRLEPQACDSLIDSLEKHCKRLGSPVPLCSRYIDQEMTQILLLLSCWSDLSDT
ncbi:uncharacterized protein MELLADRAFT_63861 [Melampsora larici-populina 98AG31]|uniref:F-box domain-containing protein n=1 Tax=Melampsora larici-populina (strain 98AG31 / pathotype 3-4-7) TaxID=747676 RepID=F4RPE3_MELLP|nr:uncharacterized protein MELLADRAFT_63861 [Melampsora larici-populina 98AG31]EGG05862.1 hypothetical protein MELLADRAFT_63861 [Melampsora larici-populina 98AG31]